MRSFNVVVIIDDDDDDDDDDVGPCDCQQLRQGFILIPVKGENIILYKANF